MHEFENSGLDFTLIPSKNFDNKKLIWQYWGQGYNDVPNIVQICLDSVSHWCANNDIVIIRLSDDNLSEYIDFPEELLSLRNNYSKAFFSDMLRCCLLSLYGGCWLDATVLLTGSIPLRCWEQDIFIYNRDKNVSNKRYWKNAFAYYYGWSKKFKVNMLSSIMFAQANNKFINSMRDIMLFTWLHNYPIYDYFFLQILWNEMITTHPEDCKISSKDDTIPHYLQQFLNDPDFDLATFDEILELTTIHKLTYKSPDVTEKLRKLLNL